ncbi:hypothetical protein AAA799P11_00074 [Marine Group I thaumarchaeote SCGC AAA799-P11]|uniref:Uncharacterized protein n=1 Tax=Marine Group I thaumarchaeote SCGC AAA799-P11 TaxID=1502295 RepID=A0A087S3M3_9ARCH|nr:hypothetical protein AAA799P11_00074 [Marine Group I thaumarchaeote SCGC AAA799-P11]
MNTRKLQRITHNIEQRVSSKMFHSEDEELGIFFALAENGPLILTSLAEKTSSYGPWEANRWAVNSRMKGTRGNISLIDFEYIKKRPHETRNRGKDGESYCLTTKGFFATLSTRKTPIEKTYLFRKYKQFISDLLNRKIEFVGKGTNVDAELTAHEKKYLKNLFVEYIKYQMYVFLIWHEANEIGLHTKINTEWYFVNFFETFEKFVITEFPKILDKKRIREYKEILRRYMTLAKTLHGIEYFSNSDNNIDKKIVKRIQINFKMMKPFVFEWFRYFDRLQMYSPVDKPYSVTKIQSYILHPPEYGIDIEYEGIPGHKKMIKPELKSIVTNELEKIFQKQGLFVEEFWKTDQREKFQKDRVP